MNKTAQDLMGEDSPSKSRLRLWLRILGFSRSVEAILRENLRQEFETTLPRFDVMAALDRHPKGLKMTELSSVLRVSNGNTTGLIDRLVESGIAERLAVPGDRRAHLICLTAEGKQQFAAMARAHEGWINECLQDFDQNEATKFAERLRLVTK